LANSNHKISIYRTGWSVLKGGASFKFKMSKND